MYYYFLQKMYPYMSQRQHGVEPIVSYFKTTQYIQDRS